MKRARAEAWNLAGRAAWNLGQAFKRAALALSGLSGSLDARADIAGYWDWHASARPSTPRAVRRKPPTCPCCGGPTASPDGEDFYCSYEGCGYPDAIAPEAQTHGPAGGAS